MLWQVLETELTVTEGLDVSLIHVKSSVPAYLLCSHSRDHLAVLATSVTVGQFSGPQLCPSGSPLRQLVVGPHLGGRDAGHEGSGCGYMLDSESWSRGVQIPVRATVDSVRDGNVTANINVTAAVNCSGLVTELISQTVKVCYVMWLLYVVDKVSFSVTSSSFSIINILFA